MPDGANSGFYIPFFEKDKIHSLMGLKAKFDGEITGGIGSSASAAVALLGALHKLTGKEINPKEIAEEAWDIEVNNCGLFGGKQDQYAAAFGGVNVFEFGKEVKVNSLMPSFIEPIKDSILLFHTGSNRKSSNIQEGLKKLSKAQIFHLDQIKNLTIEAIKVIGSGDIKKFGELLSLSWEYKKKSNKGVSTDKVDKLFDKAKELGAYGGKLCGSGGGGYCIFIVEPSRQEEFKKNIGIKWVDYQISYDGLSTRII